MSQVNILLVDDQPSKLLSYQSILQDLGENLVLARSGREALQRLLKDEFAVILLDVVMPEMDGFETAALIRQHPRWERTPIIFITAYSTSDLEGVKGYELGAVDFVFAPVLPAVLRAKVSVFVELYRKRLELSRSNEQLRIEIAERHRAEEKALQAARLAAIGEMVTGLAHESRNSLQVMQSSLQLLSRRIPQEGPPGELVAELQTAIDRLHRLFEEVRGYAVPITLRAEPHSLAELWREAWDELATVRQDRQVDFRERTDGLDLRCLVDGFGIERVFRNVLENALAACPDPARIEVSCSEANLEAGAALSVLMRDNGPGFSEEQCRRIFEPFYTTKTRGTGLGMAIVKRIVEAHGGRVAAGNAPEGGAEIEIVLPRGTP